VGFAEVDYWFSVGRYGLLNGGQMGSTRTILRRCMDVTRFDSREVLLSRFLTVSPYRSLRNSILQSLS
jgi:hypothetical protein